MLKPDGEMMGGQDKYDNYLTKLQNICTDQMGEDTGQTGHTGHTAAGQPGSGKPVYETMKSAIQNMSALPAQT